MKWNIIIHPLVLAKDMRHIGKSQHKKIFKAIRKKLGNAPKVYGAPLRAPYANYWKLRVGDYRVVYTVHDDIVEVRIIKIGARRDFEVYEALSNRLPRI